MTKTPAPVVVLGSLHYDVMVEASRRPVKGETVTGTRWYPKFGGKGGNQAVAANLHGADVRFIGATGQDDFADYLLARLVSAGISTDHVYQIANAPTGMSVAIQDSDGDYGAVIVSGANLAIPTNILENPIIWSNVTMLLLQNEVSESINIAAARKAHSLGVTVCLNAAPERKMSDDLLSLVDILIVNAIEAEALAADSVNSLESAALAAKKLSSRFTTVVVTAGENGVAAVSVADGVIKIPAKPIQVVSTHGAGDMFAGVLCAELANKSTFRNALTIANESAANHVASR